MRDKEFSHNMVGTDEALNILKIGSRNTLKKMVDCGLIKNYQFYKGGNWRFARSELETLAPSEQSI